MENCRRRCRANHGRRVGLSSTGTLACAAFAIACESVAYMCSTKSHSQEWLCYSNRLSQCCHRQIWNTETTGDILGVGPGGRK